MDNLDKALRLCNEIGLQTYGRKPYEMRQMAQWEKLQKAEAMVRQIADHIRAVKVQRRDDVEGAADQRAFMVPPT